MILLAPIWSALFSAAAAHAAAFGLWCDTVDSDGARAYLSVRVTASETLRGPAVVEARWAAEPATPWLDSRTICGLPAVAPCAAELSGFGDGGRARLVQRCGSDSAELTFRDGWPVDGELRCAVGGESRRYALWNCLGGKK